MSSKKTVRVLEYDTVKAIYLQKCVAEAIVYCILLVSAVMVVCCMLNGSEKTLLKGHNEQLGF